MFKLLHLQGLISEYQMQFLKSPERISQLDYKRITRYCPHCYSHIILQFHSHPLTSQFPGYRLITPLPPSAQILLFSWLFPDSTISWTPSLPSVFYLSLSLITSLPGQHHQIPLSPVSPIALNFLDTICPDPPHFPTPL